MSKVAAALLVSLGVLNAEVHTLTLRQAVELALKQNPEVVLARLDEQKAERAIGIARSPFLPSLVAGSGLAYSSGFPMSIEGATPAVLQARAIADVFNRPQSYRIAAAREHRRGAALDTAARQEQAALRIAELFLEAEKAARMLEIARRRAEILTSVARTVEARAGEGRELAIESRRAGLSLAQARHHILLLEGRRRQAEARLGAVLGLDPGDQVRLAEEERTPRYGPASADAAVEQALGQSRELRGLESKLAAKGFDIRAERAGRLPRLEVVAQYGLLARFNNYEEFFRKFQRHNGQLGVSFQIPLFAGAAIEPRVRLAEEEAAQLRVQIRSARGRIASETRELCQV
ncbi:MAG: TolC family protein, partial [Acidobacteriota bacterium]